MIGNQKVIAVITARGGSKGLPGKNIKVLCGKPLINWTVEVALKSKLIDELIVSTDNQEIADIATAAGATVPFLRPAKLATDAAPSVDVLKHVLDYLRQHDGLEFDIVVLLEPTSPLREDDDIDNMLLKLHTNRESFDSIVSIGEVCEHPSVVKKLDGDKIEPFCADLKTATRRQDDQPAFYPYGGVYIAKTRALLAENTLYTERCTYHLVKRYQNYEIDYLYDFLAVENIMRYEWNLE